MPANANYPNSVWDGSSANKLRTSVNTLQSPDGHDWDTVVTELMAIEADLIAKNLRQVSVRTDSSAAPVIRTSDKIVLIATSGTDPVQVTLPDPATCIGLDIVLVNSTGTQPFILPSTVLVYANRAISSRGSTVTLTSIGTNWLLRSQFGA